MNDIFFSPKFFSVMKSYLLLDLRQEFVMFSWPLFVFTKIRPWKQHQNDHFFLNFESLILPLELRGIFFKTNLRSNSASRVFQNRSRLCQPNGLPVTGNLPVFWPTFDGFWPEMTFFSEIYFCFQNLMISNKLCG